MEPDLAERLMNNVRIHVPGALDDVLKLELYNAVREFLDESEIWREDLTFNTVVGRTDYELVNATAEVARLITLVDSNSTPVDATMAEPAVILLRTSPSQVNELTATVSLLTCDTDNDDYPVLPDWIVTKYFDYFVSGLIGRMMGHPAKPYSNPVLATYHLRKFANGKGIAKTHASHKNLYSGQTWRFPLIAPTRRK